MSHVPKLTVTMPSPELWQLAGEMTMYGVSDARNALMRNRPTQGQWVLDGQKLTAVDSAGLALILDMMRYAKVHQVQLTVKGFPATVKELAEVQGLAPLLTEVQYDA